VDLFFVLSGFLIGQILIKVFLANDFSVISLLHFWKRRWFRTLPNYYFVLTLSWIYASCTTLGTGGFSTDYLLFLQNFRQRHPGFFPVAWSLAVEEWFYLLLPICLLVCHRVFRRLSKQRVMLIAMGFFLLTPMLYRYWSATVYVTRPFEWDVFDSVFRMRVVTRLDTIMFGVLGAYSKRFFPKAWNLMPRVSLLVGIGLVFWSHKIVPNSIAFYVLNQPLRAFGILLMLPWCDGFKRSWSCLSIPVTYVSMISYSMYLIHHTLVLDPILRYCASNRAGTVMVLYGVYWVLTFALSAVLYSRLEKPVMDLREARYTVTI
jgi:peptidoglycan/LPS O-acetylase OafA/YrhL